MKRVMFEVAQQSPLLLQPLTEDAIVARVGRSRGNRRSGDLPKSPSTDSRVRIQQFFAEICHAQLPTDPSGMGRLGIPCAMLMGALREAGKGLTTGRHGATKEVVTRADGETILFAFAHPEEAFLPLTDLGSFDIGRRKPMPTSDPQHASPWIVDRRKGGPNSHMIAVGGIVRPKFPQWGFRATFLVDEAHGYSIALFRHLVERAGAHIGIGGFRNGGFGRFTIQSWTETDIATDATLAA